MSKKPYKYNQMNLAIRLLAGGYLAYTAWKLREAVSESPLFLVAIVVFAVAGITLVAHAAYCMLKGEYEGAPGQAAEEESADDNAEEESF